VEEAVVKTRDSIRRADPTLDQKRLLEEQSSAVIDRGAFSAVEGT
jgi:hypothetical protein